MPDDGFHNIQANGLNRAIDLSVKVILLRSLLRDNYVLWSVSRRQGRIFQSTLFLSSYGSSLYKLLSLRISIRAKGFTKSNGRRHYTYSSVDESLSLDPVGAS